MSLGREKMKEYFRGIKRGMPICLGYIPVSFAFGITAIGLGFTTLQATIIAITNMASAGQLAGVQLIHEHAAAISIIVTTFVINMRYMLMSFTLTQKIVPNMPWWKRCMMAFCICDEVFVFATMEKDDVTFPFYMGLMTMPIVGWTGGTFLGAMASTLFSPTIQSCMSMGLYFMFIAIIVPEARKSRKVAAVIVLASVLTCIFTYVPYINTLSKGGWGVIIAAIASAAIGASMKSANRCQKAIIKAQTIENEVVEHQNLE